MQEGPYFYMYTVAGPDRLSVAERKRHWELLVIIRLGRITLDPEPLVAVFQKTSYTTAGRSRIRGKAAKRS